jgi:hypothetical protein
MQIELAKAESEAAQDLNILQSFKKQLHMTVLKQ